MLLSLPAKEKEKKIIHICKDYNFSVIVKNEAIRDLCDGMREMLHDLYCYLYIATTQAPLYISCVTSGCLLDTIFAMDHFQGGKR